MPIYDHNGNVLSEVPKIYDHNGTTLSRIGKVYDNNGTADSLIYTAEQSFPDLSIDLPYNWVGYKISRSEVSTESWDLTGFSSLTFSYDITNKLGTSSPNGRGCRAYLYLVFGSAEYLVFEHRGAKSGVGGKEWHYYGTATVDLEGRSLGEVKMKLKNDDLYDLDGGDGSLYTSGTVYNVVAT